MKCVLSDEDTDTVLSSVVEEVFRSLTLEKQSKVKLLIMQNAYAKCSRILCCAFVITNKNILMLFPNEQPILDTVFTAGQMVV